MWAGFGGVAILGFRPRLSGLMEQFELYRSAHPEGGMAALAVVEDLQVVEDCIGQFNSSLPVLAVR